MSDYRSNKTGKVVSEEKINELAKEANYSFEEYLIAGEFELYDEKGKEPGVTEIAAADAPINFAADTDLVSDDISLESPEPEIRKGRAQQRKAELEKLAEPEEEEEDIDWLKEAGTQLKANTKRALGSIARIPNYLNEISAGVVKDVFLSEEEKKIFDELPDDVQLMIAGGGTGSPLTNLDLAKKGEEYFQKAKAEADKINKNLVEFDQSIGEDILSGQLGRAAGRAVTQAVGSLPSMVQAFAGPVGIASIVLGSAAEASDKSKEEGLPLGIKSTGYSTTIGLSEGLLELVTRGIGKSVFKSLFKKPKEYTVKTVKEIATNLSKNFGQEGLSEVATDVINRTADAAFLGKEDVFKDSFTELIDVFIVGGVAGGALGSVKGGADFVQNRKAKKGIDKIVSTIDAKETNEINALFDKAMADPVTKAQIGIVKDKNTKLGLSFILNQSLKKGEITKEQAAQSLTKFDQVQSTVRQVEKTGLDFTPEQGVEVVNLISEKNDLKSKIEGVDEALASVQKERIKEIDESIKRIAKDATEVKLKAETEVVEKLAGEENVKVFDTTEEFVKVTGKPAEADAFEDTDGTIFINKQRAAEVGAFSAPSHELLHRVLKSTFSDKTTSTNLVKDFNKVLEKQGFLDVVQKRIDDNYRFNKDGSEKAFDEYAEEYLTAFSDAIAKKDIEFNETKFQKLMQPIVKFFRKIGYNKIEFKNGRDVYDFIKDYRKNIEKGELSKRATELQAKGQTVKSTAKASITKINEQIEALEESYDNGELDFDDYDQQLTNLESKLEKAKAAPVTEVKKAKPKEDKREVKQLGDALNKLIPEGTTNKEYKERVVGTVAADLSGKTLNPLIKKIAAGYGIVADNVYGKSWEDFYIAVKGVQFIKNLQKFNPEINDDFGGFVIGSQYGIRNRVKEALIKFKKEAEGGFKEDVSTAKGIAAEETTAPVAPEKAKYKNLLQQKVLSTEGLKTARTKVISSVRVLKSKIDAAITKNVATTPIIDEIRLSVGKQLDIIFKKEMGGKPKEKFKNYLLTNKKAILENLTTTYLLRAIPQAIQKSVGGKYLLDKDGKRVINSFGDATFVPNFVGYDVWKDAKVDREKTSTEAAGRTSGNEITRRTPKVSEAISDQEFLDIYLNEDGSLVKGRKESLAKALGEEVAFDMIKQDLQTDGPIFEALKNNQEALGVVITDTIQEELSRQIERGNIKFSLTTQQNILEGIKVLEQNSFDQNSSEFKKWYASVNDESKKFWDEEVSFMFVKEDGAVRSEFTKNKAKQIEKFPFLKDGIEKYNEGILNSQNTEKANIAKEQLENFWGLIAPIVDPAILKIKGLNFLGSASRTSKPNAKVESILRKKPQSVSKAAQDALNELLPVIDNVTVYSGNSSAMNAIREFMTSYEGKPNEIAEAFSQNKISEEIEKAKQANTLLFKYLNILAAEAVINQSTKENVNSAFAGYLRWLETNNNNDSGLKGLAHVIGFEVLSNQAVYLDRSGKKFYSLKSESEIIERGEPGKNQLKINKKHTNWKNAEAAMLEKIKNSKPEKRKNWSKLTRFEKDKAIASSLEIKGEHQQSMGETGIKLAEAVSEAVDNVFNKSISKKTAFEIYNNKLNLIAEGFGIVLNSRFVSDIQDKVFGKTSRLRKSRLAAVEKSVSENIYDFKGEKIVEQGQKEIATIIEELAKIQISEDSSTETNFSKTKESKILSKEFNEMIARQKGVDPTVEYSKIVAKRMGAQKGKYKVYLPSSAEDFRLLTGYTFAGKGKQGDKDMRWFDENLIRPYTKAINDIDVAKQTTKQDFKALNKAMPEQAKSVGNLIPSKDYTNDQAIRVYLWNKAGYKVPGLDTKEVNKLVSYVSGNPKLAIYADSLLAISKSKKWLKPGEHWDVQTILSDINNLTEKGGRKAYLAKWIENVDAIFSETNLNKIEALYGKRHREALEDTLYRMKNGTNRPSGANAQVNRWNNWLNNSIGSIMFFNRRSAIMQLLSTVNFINWSDNNPLNAAKAFGNQKQYWKDFAYIFNSDKLKQRRGGLRADVNEAEIASAAANSKNKAQAALSWLLKKGFTPTQIADSFAIASGGATFYRNRINTYEKQGLDTKEAENKAWLDFIETSDQAQQSGDPSLVSMEQASILGRLVLAFQNTTQQYSRIMKRSGLDLIKRRQMPGTSSMLQSDFANFSRIMYYGAIQNVIFSALSASLFALIPGFDDNEEDESEAQKTKEKKIAYMFNGSVDSLLRGMGVRGAVVSTIKNVIMEYFKQKEKGFTADHTYTIIQAVNLSPPIGSKIKKVYGAIKGYEYEKDVIKERGFDITANGRLNLSPGYRVFGSLSAGAVNLPIDRVYTEIQGMAEMMDERNTMYQRLALSLGWRTWDVNAKNEEDDLIKAESKAVRKKEGVQKAKAKRVAKKEKLISDRKEMYNSLSGLEQLSLDRMSKNQRKKVLDKMIKNKDK